MLGQRRGNCWPEGVFIRAALWKVYLAEAGRPPAATGRPLEPQIFTQISVNQLRLVRTEWPQSHRDG